MRRVDQAAVMAFALACGCGGAGSMRDTGTAGSTTGDDATTGGSDDEGASDEGVYDEEQVFELRLNEDPPPPLVLQMDRAEVGELFGATAKDILLLELDSTPLLTNTLEDIKNACGQGWREDDPDPQHDCSLSALGQTFMGPDGTWQTSAEYALVRILTMTPANVDVTGTSSEGLQEMADTFDIGGGYSQILADALGIPRTQEIVSTDSLVLSFQENFVGTHPAITDGAKLSITLEDALSDLATLADRYGPMDGHPGIIDPSFVPHGEVFGPDFQMIAEAASNLRLVDGVDADQGKGFMSVIADEVGPGYQDELEFDFEDPEKFRLEGIIPNLTVDLRFALAEHDAFVDACAGDAACQANLPGMPYGQPSVWSISPWLFELDVAAGGYHDYVDRTFYGSYALGTAKVLIGQDGNPPGWVVYDIPFGLGNPPQDQYLWETILEVAQVALHSTPFATFPEGTADVAFTMTDVPVGLTGAQAAEAVRPYLQEQSSELSDYILGDYKKNNDYLDFYYQRANDGEPYLFFVAEGDLREGEPYTYASPGFYEDSSLSPDEKASSPTIAGLVDSVHEKLHVPEGETVVWFADDGGQVYRARISRPAGSDVIEIGIARKIG
jgi:hypothetical protein